MSITLSPYKVDWNKFLRSFPIKTARSREWLLELDTELHWDNLRFSQSWSDCYEILRVKLSWSVLLATEPFVQSTTHYPIHKKLVKFNQFTPPCKFTESEFIERGFNILPTMSPGAIVDVLAYLDSVPRSEIVDEFHKAWEMTAKKISKVCGFLETPDSYMSYFDNWEAILREVKAGNNGMCILLDM